MGLSNDERLRRSSEAEESLPLYVEAQPPVAADLSAPDPKATPDEVRDFLVHALQVRCGISIDHARRIASRWTTGSGRELRSYPATMYRELFGNEDAWAVYRAVRPIFYDQEKGSRRRRYRIHVMLLVLFIAIFVACIGIMVSGLDEIWVFVAFIGSWAAFAGIVVAAVTLENKDDSEKIAETELQALDWSKTPGAQASAT